MFPIYVHCLVPRLGVASELIGNLHGLGETRGTKPPINIPEIGVGILVDKNFRRQFASKNLHVRTMHDRKGGESLHRVTGGQSQKAGTEAQRISP